MHMRLLWMVLFAVAPAWACSCIGTATPCSEVGGDSVIFVARVVVDSGEDLGTGPAKVIIEEPLQNVPDGQREVEINTMARTSCYSRLEAGERYVVITEGPNYIVAGCSPSFRLRGNEHILDAMRAAIKGAPSRLTGIVRKRTGRYSEEDGVPGASVVVEAGGPRRAVTADGLGHFTVMGLEPGRYKVSVSKPGFMADTDYPQDFSLGALLERATNGPDPNADIVEVPKRACVIHDLAMWPAGSIGGIVRSREGLPQGGVAVQAFTFDDSNKFKKRDSSPLRTTKSAADGSYKIEPLPSGKYVIGVNGDEYEDNDVYPPTFYADSAPVFIAESGSANGIDFALPPPRPAAQLRVTVIGPDGHPYQGASIRLETLQGQVRGFSKEKSDAKGEISVQAYLGERYSIRSFSNVFIEKKLVQFEGVVSLEVVDRKQPVTIMLREAKR